MKPFEANQPYHLVLLKICGNHLQISLQNLSNMMLTLPPIVHLKWPPAFPLHQKQEHQ